MTHLLRVQSKIGLIKQYMELIKAWDESKHERDERGRFSNVSRGSRIEEMSQPGYKDRFISAGRQIARSLNFPPHDLIFKRSSEMGVGTAGGYHPITGDISINIGLTPRLLRGVLSHEIMHAKFAEYKGKELSDPTFIEKLQKSDGMTAYSRSFWKNYKEQVAQAQNLERELGKPGRVGAALVAMRLNSIRSVAIHETLAEMARIRVKSGVLRGTNVWKDFYQRVDESYQKQERIIL